MKLRSKRGNKVPEVIFCSWQIAMVDIDVCLLKDDDIAIHQFIQYLFQGKVDVINSLQHIGLNFLHKKNSRCDPTTQLKKDEGNR